MELYDFAKEVECALSKNHMITAFVKCDVEYDGRAKSHLDVGDRLIVIKPDKTFLVHQNNKHVPVNYMKTDALHAVKKLDSGEVLLECSNPKAREVMKVIVSQAYHFHSQKLEDSESIVVKGTESDMAQYIMDNPISISESFKPVKREEQTKYGFVDVLGHEDDVLVVVECKRFNADLAAVTQLRRYVERIKSSKGIDNVKGILAAPRITPQAHAMLQDWDFSFKQVIPPNTNHIVRDSKQKKLDF